VAQRLKAATPRAGPRTGGRFAAWQRQAAGIGNPAMLMLPTAGYLRPKIRSVRCTLERMETPNDARSREGEEAAPTAAAMEPVEARSVRLRRHGHRAVLYTWAFAAIGLVIVIVALAAANAHKVKLSWVFGSGHASLVWIVIASVVLGWLLGIVTAIIFRLRTRRRRGA
jgi:uncharacterized integral membrane protein